MPTKSTRVSDILYLVQQSVSEGGLAKPKEVPTNHVVVIDCSGSMSWELPKIREQLKRKLPKLLKEKDTISIVWFSGRGQHGVLLEGEPVATLADLKDVEAAIDRWLKPVGMTGFKEPLDSVPALVEKVAKRTPGSTFSLFFMSDGQDNAWPRPDILKAVEKASSCVSAATFVEYGYYADRPLLTQMAEKCGGAVIHAADFDRYAPTFEAAMQKRLTGAPRVEVKIPGDVVGGFAFAVVGDELLTFAVEAGFVQVPEDIGEMWYLSPTPIGEVAGDLVGFTSPVAA